MPIEYDALMATAVEDVPCEYNEKSCLLYALGVGFGADPLDRIELPYVFEGAALRTVPTMASTLLSTAFISGCGWDYSQVVHEGECLSLYRPLPPASRLLANRKVAAVHDLGPDIGARIVLESEVRLAKDDTVLFNLERTLLARGDGGVGGLKVTGKKLHALPEREPDMHCTAATRPDQALIFRLADDLNPIHADPALARRVGFERPILQSACTYGIACRSILRTICDYDFTLISGFDAHFREPVYPGDTLTTEMWQDRNVVSFRCTVEARNSVVLDNGMCTLAA